MKNIFKIQLFQEKMKVRINEEKKRKEIKNND